MIIFEIHFFTDEPDNLTANIHINETNGEVTILTSYKHLTNLSWDDVIVINVTVEVCTLWLTLYQLCFTLQTFRINFFLHLFRS